jgi:hypothetical protein
MTITKDIQAFSKELTKLAKQIENLAAELGKAEKQPSFKIKTKAKAISKKAPAKAAKKSYAEKVISIIERSKKDVDADTLMDKNGLDRDQVHQIIFKTHKLGKIKRIEKGI